MHNSVRKSSLGWRAQPCKDRQTVWGWKRGSGLSSVRRLVAELELRGSEALSKASPDAPLRGKPAWYSLTEKQRIIILKPGRWMKDTLRVDSARIFL